MPHLQNVLSSRSNPVWAGIGPWSLTCGSSHTGESRTASVELVERPGDRSSQQIFWEKRKT